MIAVIGAAIGVYADVLKGLTQVCGQCLTELFCRFGIAIVVVNAPSTVDIVDAPCGGRVDDLVAGAFAHTLLKERDDGIVLGHITLPCKVYGMRFGKTIAVCDNPLESLNCLEYDTFTLGINIKEIGCDKSIKRKMVAERFRVCCWL